MTELKPEQIQETINQYIRNELQRLEDIRNEGELRSQRDVEEYGEYLQNSIGDDSIDLQNNDYFSAGQTVQEILESHNLPIDRDGNEFNPLCRKLLKARIAMHKVECNRNGADYSDNEKELFPLRSDGNGTDDDKADNSELISKLIDPFLEAEKGRWKKDKSKKDYPVGLNLFIEAMGDLPVQSVTRKLMRKYMGILEKLPPNKNKIKIYRDKSIPELLQMNIEKTLSPSRINKYMDVMSVFMQWAIGDEYYTKTNPATRLKIRDDRDPRDKRAPYTNEELEWLFRSEQYIKDTFIKSYMFWTPLIALFHGMRREEVSSLFLDDIKMSDDEGESVWIFDFVDSEGKTKAARRRVPIHPFLLDELNFIAYVEKLRKAGEKRLFSELPNKADGYGTNVGKWFNGEGNRVGYKKKCGIKSVDDDGSDGRKRDFHSFRTTFMTHLARKGIYDDNMVLKEVVGHSLGKNVTSIYIDKFPADYKLKEIISKVDFEKQINMSHLKQSRYVVG